jgi:hypothetical protein
MIDITAELVLPLAAAAKRQELPRRRHRKRPNVSTLYRWARQGVRNVHLETIRVGGTLCTSVQALQRFFDALSRTDSLPNQSTAPARRRAADEDAARKLDAEGF